MSPACFRCEVRGLLPQLFVHLGNLAGHWRTQVREIPLQALPARRELREQVRDIFALGFDHPHGLLDERDPLLHGGEHRRGRRYRLLARRHHANCIALVVAGAFPRRDRIRDGLLDGGAVSLQCGLLARERADLLGQLGDLLRDPGFAFAREGELLLQPRHLGVRFVEPALPLVQARRRRRNDRRAAPRASPPRRAHLPAGLEGDREARDLRSHGARGHRTASCCFANHSRCCDSWRRVS